MSGTADWGWEEHGPARVWSPKAVRAGLLEAFASGALDPASDAPAAGRGAVARLDLLGSRVVARRVRRGGLLGALAPWLVLSPDRAVHEADLTLRARAASLPVPEPVGVVACRRGLLMDVLLVTREIAGVETSSAALAAANPAHRELLLSTIAAALRRAHDAGLVHTDLNLANILLSPAPSYAVSFVDLDRARWAEGGASMGERFDGLARVARSGEKLLGLPAEQTLRDLIQHYGAQDEPLRAALTNRIPGWRRSMAWHRLGWSLSGARGRSRA